MPGPNVINKKAQQNKAAAVQRQTYYLTDPACTTILGLAVTDEMRTRGMVLTAAEAMTLVASGAVTTDKDAADKAIEEQNARSKALADSRQAAADAEAKAADEAARAQVHNAGGEAMDTGKPADGTLSSAEADTAMAQPASGQSSPETIPPAVVAAEAVAQPQQDGQQTWASGQAHEG